MYLCYFLLSFKHSPSTSRPQKETDELFCSWNEGCCSTRPILKTKVALIIFKLKNVFMMLIYEKRKKKCYCFCFNVVLKIKKPGYNSEMYNLQRCFSFLKNLIILKRNGFIYLVKLISPRVLFSVLYRH